MASPHRTAAGREPVRAEARRKRPYYESPEEMRAKIDEYFEDCDNRQKKIYDKKTKEIVEIPSPEPYTIAGLALFLGFNSRSGILNYEGQPDFADVVAYARMKIEAQRSVQLIEKSGIPGGVIFDLKNNHGWRDESSVEVSGPGGGPIQIGLVSMPPKPKDMAEWRAWYEATMNAKPTEEIIDAEFETLSLPCCDQQMEVESHERDG